MSTGLVRQLRLLLESSPQALPAPDVYSLVDAFVLECSASHKPEVLLFRLEDELQAIHRDSINLAASEQTETFLTVLRRLEPVLSSTSLISTWFELVLRPALREPKLSRGAVAHAKDLVIEALEKADTNYPDKQGEFRRRILDLYLLDAFNEGSGDDVLEWAELPADDREKRNVWKANLEDILVRFGMDKPEALLTQVFHCFASPSSRLQLLGLLNRYTSQPSFDRHACILASHPLMSSILTSLLVDNSTTVCTIGLTMLTRLLPILAVKECGSLRRMLPQLFAILARIICWRERELKGTLETDGDQKEGEADATPQTAVEGPSRALDIHPELEWERLELVFNSTAAPAPSPRQYFTFLYYLFPCNLVAFLREPAEYLTERHAENPYAVNWDEALDHEQIKTRSEILLRQHVTHPQIIWRNAATEISETEFFASYDVPRIVAECLLLEIRNSQLGLQPHIATPVRAESATVIGDEQTTEIPEYQSPSSTPPLKAVEVCGKPRVSLQEMVNTSITLKSHLDVELVDPTPIWPYCLFPLDPGASSVAATPDPAASAATSPERGGTVPSHVVQAISGLQREVLLLKTELNFESWLARENVKQIGRLYEQRIMSRNAEVERQGLHNKLREYKTEVAELRRHLREHTEQTALTKKKYADWNTELQRKLEVLREQKRSWTSETAALRLAEKEVRAHHAAQGILLAEAEQRVFQLETSVKENAHKVDRLRDYEKRIEQLMTLQKLWDADVQKYKDQSELMKVLLSQYKKMELRLDTYEKTHAELEEQARVSRRQIQTLEAKLSAARKMHSNRPQSTQHATYIKDAATKFMDDNNRLRKVNAELTEEIEEMKAMVEVLRAQVSGHSGVLVDPTRSPVIGSALHLS
ncbi:hypothetical protein BV25DRAFT_1869288 [Artomyces pyxidatus]|uniref:Uncharacterized protein n=1 Tax=Artomyces pyxidatus TaxID=48021 RepID=A0ACB8T9C5_9AGAM|nr:hypothetical protein BV25DRAFT_1869288 [Artomyces pyxidatus]